MFFCRRKSIENWCTNSRWTRNKLKCMLKIFLSYNIVWCLSLSLSISIADFIVKIAIFYFSRPKDDASMSPIRWPAHPEPNQHCTLTACHSHDSRIQNGWLIWVRNNWKCWIENNALSTANDIETFCSKKFNIKATLTRSPIHKQNDNGCRNRCN